MLGTFAAGAGSAAASAALGTAAGASFAVSAGAAGAAAVTTIGGMGAAGAAAAGVLGTTTAPVVIPVAAGTIAMLATGIAVGTAFKPARRALKSRQRRRRPLSTPPLPSALSAA